MQPSSTQTEWGPEQNYYNICMNWGTNLTFKSGFHSAVVTWAACSFIRGAQHQARHVEAWLFVYVSICISDYLTNADIYAHPDINSQGAVCYNQGDNGPQPILQHACVVKIARAVGTLRSPQPCKIHSTLVPTSINERMAELAYETVSEIPDLGMDVAKLGPRCRR